jgi:hypothetical protein
MVTAFHSVSKWKDFLSESDRLEEAGSILGCNALALPAGGILSEYQRTDFILSLSDSGLPGGNLEVPSDGLGRRE